METFQTADIFLLGSDVQMVTGVMRVPVLL